MNLNSVQALRVEDYDWASHFVIESDLRASRADGIRAIQVRQFTKD
ncbi:hypothetical protein [Streptomyces sp. Agncl-13]